MHLIDTGRQLTERIISCEDFIVTQPYQEKIKCGEWWCIHAMKTRFYNSMAGIRVYEISGTFW